MEDETLNNVLNLLQNATGNHSNNNQTTSTNNDIQTLLIKFLLSGGLNQIMNLRNQNSNSTKTESTQSEKLRTIDLTNYQRLD